MDIDDNDAQDQNLQLVGEGSSKVSPVLHSYALPKFEFDDSLHGHLRFDSLVDNEVFLGITSQEDNQWIEEYSRGTSSIQFSSSVVESTRKNVWSEATSLESVEMLLKSVGQEEKVVEETSIEELDACDSVNNIMDSTLQEKIVEPKVSSDCQQSHATLESQYQEIQISAGELNSVVRGEQKTEKICDDVHQEAIKLANESSVNELQEDPSFSKVECSNAGSSRNFDASAEKNQEDFQIPETSSENSRRPKNFDSSKPDHIIKNEENRMDNSTNSGTVVEIGTLSVEKFSVASNVECVDKPTVEGSIPICKEPTVSLPLESCGMQIDEDCNAHIGSAEQSECSNSAVSDSQICSKVDQEVIDNVHGVSLGVSPNSACVETQAIEDADMKSEVSEFSKCNVGSLSSLSHLHSYFVEETENDVGGDDKSEMGKSLAASPNHGCVATQATEDVDMKLEVSDFPKYNVGFLSSPSHLHSLSAEETENGVGSDGKSEMGEALGVSPNSGCVPTQATEDVDTKSKISDYQKSNVGSLSSPSHLHSHTVEETENGAGISETGEALAASPKSGSVTIQATEDVNTKSEISDYQKSNVGSVSSPSHLHSHTVEETENGAGSAGISETGEALAVSPTSGCVLKQTIEDADTKPEIFDFPKDNVGSLSSLPHLCSSVKEAENDVGIDGISEMGEGSGINDAGKTLLTSGSLTEMPARDVSNKPEIPGNNALKAHKTEIIVDSQKIQGDDETQPSEPDAITKGQETTFNERRDEKLSLDFRVMDMDVVGSPDSQKVVEPSSSFEGCEGAIAMGQGSESITTVLTDAAAAAESSKISSPDTSDGAQLPSGTVSAADVSEDQPRSPPIPGPSLLHSGNEEKVELGSSQIGTTVVDIKVDCALDCPLPVVETDDTSDGAEKVVHELAVHCDPLVGNLNASPSEQTAEDNLGGPMCSKTLETSALPCNSTAKCDHNAGEGRQVVPQESITGEDGVEPLNLEVSTSSEQQTSIDLAGPSELAINHEEHNRDGAALSDNPEVFSMLETKNVELSDSVEVVQEATKGNMYENSPLSTVSKDDAGLQPVPSVSETKEETIFTFDVNASDGQNISLLKNTKVSSANSCGSQLDAIKLPEDILASPQPPGVAASEAGAKLVSERKPRRQSVGRESAKKGNQLKQTTSTRRSRKGEKSSALINSPASGHVTPPVKDLKSSESIECSNPKTGAVRPISTPNLLGLNSSTHLFQQSFTDNQQLQLRAQIFVYGSLISGVPPEEPHMIAAFGQSDGGRTLWEGAWHACLERIHRHKSKANNLGTPMQSQSGNRDSEEGIKIVSAQRKVISSPIVSPMFTVSSPLWNVSTPCDGSQSSAMPRSHFLDYRPALSPLHPYQSPQVQSIVGHHPSWPSQGPLPGQWVSSSPVTPFSARLSALPITESVKLTTVKESGVPRNPGIPVDPSAGSTVSSGPSSVSNVKKAMVSSGQPKSDSKSRKRKKVSTSQAEVASLSAPVAHLSWTPRTEGYTQISFPAQTQTNSGTPLVVTSHSSTSAPLSTPFPIISKSSHGELSRDQNMEKIVTTKDIESKIEESKGQAVDAAVHAAAAVSHCQSLWNQLETRKSSGLVSDDEAKLASSAVSIAAASSVAKVAAAAAKIASNVAEQAKLMADEVFRASTTESNISLHDKANSVISAAREAARRRIEAASAASKHAENLDAIVKAAELAAEAVSQAGKIVSMGNPLPIRELVEAGPEGYWKTPLSNQQGYSDKRSIETAANDEEFQTLKHGVSLQEGPGDIAKKQMMNIDGISGSSTIIENEKSIVSGHKGPDLSKTVEVISGSEFGSVSTYDVDHNMPQGTSGTWKENIIREGCFVEVYKDDDKNKGAWFSANVLTLKDGNAFVCYTEIQSDDGSGTLKEWVPLEAEAIEAPRIRIAHPMTTLRVERTRKRGRTAITDYVWCSGDRVDVWVQDRWCEAVVVETNRIDLTSLTVDFPAQEKTSVVRSWHVRPTLIWKDGKWIEWSSLKGCRSSEGETPHEKRQKFGDPILESKEKSKASSIVIDLVEAGRHQDSSVLPSSVQGSSFDIGKSSKNGNKLNTHRTMKSGVQKDRSRVVFGVPKPGKKQKFMDVSTHYVPNDSVKPASHSMPRGSKDDSKNDAKEKQVAEVKSKALKSRKPPVPLARPLAQKDKSKTSKHTSRDAILTDKVVKDSLCVDENLSGHQNQMDFGSSSDTEDGRETSTSKASQRLNKRKIALGDRKANKVEVRDISTSEAEPRRSNRRIQPTSRLLEGLQSSLSVSKIPSVPHASQRSHNKVTSKGKNTSASKSNWKS